MKRLIQFREEVSNDIFEACRWYDDREDGLGKQFAEELQATLDRVAQNPHTYAAGYRRARSARLHRFPYVVRYRIVDDVVVVFAVMRGSRHPSKWHERFDIE